MASLRKLLCFLVSGILSLGAPSVVLVSMCHNHLCTTVNVELRDLDTGNINYTDISLFIDGILLHLNLLPWYIPSNRIISEGLYNLDWTRSFKKNYLISFVFQINCRMVHERSCAMIINTNFLLPISLQPDVVNLWHFKLWILFGQIVSLKYQRKYTTRFQRYRNNKIAFVIIALLLCRSFWKKGLCTLHTPHTLIWYIIKEIILWSWTTPLPATSKAGVNLRKPLNLNEYLLFYLWQL